MMLRATGDYMLAFLAMVFFERFRMHQMTHAYASTEGVVCEFLANIPNHASESKKPEVTLVSIVSERQLSSFISTHLF